MSRTGPAATQRSMSADTGCKRVGILLRVSTQAQAKQLDNDVDIPTQRNACLRFMEQHPDWVLEKEYMEIGVSGYKNAMADRDKLLEIREDIRSGVIQVLVVFMFDRLGRIEEETPFVVKSFVDMGAEVWSVKEGQRRFDAHVDNLLNYLYFWQASGESRKTSERVSNAMNQMAEAGRYTGGRPPFGYSLAETGRLTRRKVPEKTLAICEEEAVTVRLIYDLALHKGYGCHRIARHLNERGILTRTGREWGHAAISNILGNPIYMGVRAYNRTSGKGLGSKQKRLPPEQWILSPSKEEWRIVSEECWQRVYRARKALADAQSASAAPPVKSRLLLAGIAYCGHCGAKLQTGYSPYRWRTADGCEHRRNKPVYRCGARASGKTSCNGKSVYSRDAVEAPVIQLVEGWLLGLSARELKAALEAAATSRRDSHAREIAALRRSVESILRETRALEAEVVRSITGDSAFEPQLLRNLLQEKEEQLQAKNAQLEDCQSFLSIGVPASPHPLELFRSLPMEEQRVILRQIVRRVDHFEDRSEIQLFLGAESFLPSALSNI